MEIKANDMEKHVERRYGHLDQTGPAFGQTPARFDLDAAWQRLLQLPLGLLGILATGLLLLAISLPQTTNATIPGPAATVTPTVTPSPTVTPEAASHKAPAANDRHSSSSSFSSVPAAGGASMTVAGRVGHPNTTLLMLHSELPYCIGPIGSARSGFATHTFFLLV